MLTPQTFSAVRPYRIAFAFVPSLVALRESLCSCHQERFTGQLDIKIQHTQAKPWSLYFEQGELTWGGGGVHPIRSWYRQVSQQISTAAIAAIYETANRIQPENYEFLTAWLLQKTVPLAGVKAIVAGLLSELLFDLHHQWSHDQTGSNLLEVKFSYLPAKQTAAPFTISLDEVWLQAGQNWQAWESAGLENYNPNHAPVIQDIQALQQQVLPRTYQNLTTAINGEQTLRDLAVKSNKDLLTITRSLLPYVQQGLVGLLEIKDLQPDDRNFTSTEAQSPNRELTPVTTAQQVSSSSLERDQSVLKTAYYPASSPILSPKDWVESDPNLNRNGDKFFPGTAALGGDRNPDRKPQYSKRYERATPLIAYVDDYPVDGETMHQILDQIGYRLIHIQDPMQALPLLLEHKPELIFLDLVMPIVNGYEACAQIRRVSRFKDTPIIILTSNDGIIDRVRAKIVGSTDFLAKPIELKKVQMILKKHLMYSNPSS